MASYTRCPIVFLGLLAPEGVVALDGGDGEEGDVGLAGAYPAGCRANSTHLRYAGRSIFRRKNLTFA